MRSLLTVALCGLLFLMLPTTATAAVTITFTEVGGDVVATLAGSIDLTGLTLAGTFTGSPAFVDPAGGNYHSSGGSWEIYGATLDSSFTYGTGPLTSADTASGDDFRVFTSSTLTIGVPVGYVSGAPLSSTATWTGETLASLGIGSGTFTYTYGAVGGQTITFTTVPEPSSISLFGLAGLAILLRRRRSKTASA